MEMFQALTARAQAGSLLTARPFTGRPQYPAIAGQEASKPFSDALALEEAITASAMLWRCVVPKAEKAASRPWRVWERPKSGTGEGVPIHDHPYIERIEYPATPQAFPGEEWKARQFGREQMMAMAHTHRDLAGRSLFGLEAGRDFRNNGLIVRRMDNVDPRPIYPVPDADGAVGHWNYRGNEQFAYAGDALIDVRRTRPDSKYYGLGVVEAIALHVDSVSEGQELQLRRYSQDGTPGMILSAETVSTAAGVTEYEEALRRKQAMNRGGIMVLPAAVGAETKLVASGLPVEHLGLLDALAFDVNMIAIGCGYLPAGFSNDAATYSNYSVFVLHEWHLVIEANAAFADAFTRTFVPFEERGRYYIAPDYRDVPALQDVAIEKLKLIGDLAFKGVSMNDIIRATGAPLELQKDGDKPLVPDNVGPLSAALRQEI